MPNRERFAILADHFRKVKAGQTKVGVFMDYWFQIPFGSPLLQTEVKAGDLLNECGTTACIAGTAIMLFDRHRYLSNRGSAFGNSYVEFSLEDGIFDRDIAGDLLELNEEEANTLFMTFHWGDYWENKYDNDEAGTMAEICQMIADGADVEELLNREDTNA